MHTDDTDDTDLEEAKRRHPSAQTGVAGRLHRALILKDPRPGFARSPRKSQSPQGTDGVAGPLHVAQAPSDPRPVAFPKPPIVCLHRKGES